MEISLIASFWIVSFLLIITPGADWAYAISAGINGCRVVPAVMGLMSGHLLATIIVVAGVGVLIAGHPLALSAITCGRGLFIVARGHDITPSGGAGRGATIGWQLECVGGEGIMH